MLLIFQVSHSHVILLFRSFQVGIANVIASLKWTKPQKAERSHPV